jgi:hypothetical protein
MRRIALLVMLALPLAFAPAHADSRTESHTYLGGTGDAAWLACPDPDCPAEYVGGAPFTLEGDESSAAIVIQDDVNAFVGGFYEVRDANDVALSSGSFCGSTTATIGAGAVSLQVFVDEAFGLIDCGSARGFGVKGTITVTFS